MLTGMGSGSIATSLLTWVPPVDDTYWIGSATLGFKGFHMPDTFITDDVGVVKFRTNADDAYVGIAALTGAFGAAACAAAPSTTQVVNIQETYTFTDNTERFGIYAGITGVKTSAAFTNTMPAITGRALIGAANTQDWTNLNYGPVGIEGAIRFVAGSTGTIARAVSILARCEIFGATATRWYGLEIESPNVSGGVITTAYGIYLPEITAGGTNYQFYNAAGFIFNLGYMSTRLTPDLTANSQSLNSSSTASTLTMANTKSFTGVGHRIILPAIVPVANGGGITLTGLNMSQGAITDAADSEAITVKQLVITGAAGVALETGVYTWTGADITMPAQVANAANNAFTGIKITGGALAGGASAYQRGVDITMAAATDNAVYVGTGQSYFGGNIVMANSTSLSGLSAVSLTYNGGQVGITATTYRDNSGLGYIAFYGARGSLASPTNIGNGDSPFSFEAYGYYSAAFRRIGSLFCVVDGVPSGGLPGRWEFYTTPNGSYTQALRWTINSSGNLIPVDGLYIGQVSGPQIAFDDTNNLLKLQGTLAGVTALASTKIYAASGVIGFSTVSTALTLGSAGSVVVPYCDMGNAANDAARDVLAGNVDGAIAIDSVGVTAVFKVWCRVGGAWKGATIA